MKEDFLAANFYHVVPPALLSPLTPPDTEAAFKKFAAFLFHNEHTEAAMAAADFREMEKSIPQIVWYQLIHLEHAIDDLRLRLQYADADTKLQIPPMRHSRSALTLLLEEEEELLKWIAHQLEMNRGLARNDHVSAVEEALEPFFGQQLDVGIIPGEIVRYLEGHGVNDRVVTVRQIAQFLVNDYIRGWLEGVFLKGK